MYVNAQHMQIFIACFFLLIDWLIDWIVAAIAELLDNAVDEVTQISFMFYCVTEVVTRGYQHHTVDLCVSCF